MQNLKFPESWEQAIKNTLDEHGDKPQLVGITYAAKHMAEMYEARIVELEKQLMNTYTDSEADGWVFCGKCGHQK